MKRLALPVAAFLFLVSADSLARDPAWWGLGAVAASPDGATVVAGGQSRTLYVLDGRTLDVTRRIWVEARVGELCFNKDGSRLVVEDETETLYYYDTQSWDVVKKVEKAGYMNCVPAADLLAAYRWDGERKIVFLSMTDGSEKGEAVLPDRIRAFGLDAGAKRLAALTDGPDDKEKKIPYNEIPEELEGIDKDTFRQKNDGRMSVYTVFEVPSGKRLSGAETWFSTSWEKSELILGEEKAWVLNYDNKNAVILPSGETTLFRSGNSFNYGIGVSPDRKRFLTGGLRDGSLGDVDSLETTPFEIERMRGWPEYFARFSFQADGTGWGVTSNFRLVKISKEGKVEKVVPVY